MTSRGPNRRGRQTRAALLEAGLDAFHADGFTAVGVERLVGAAGVPKGSFYNLFDSKEAFAAEVIDLYFARNLEVLERFFDDPAVPPLERLRNYFAALVDFYGQMGYTRGCLMGNLAAESADHGELIRARLAENFGRWTAVLATAVAEAQQRGEIDNPLDAQVIADFLLNSWEGALARMKAEHGPAPLQAATDVFFSTILV